MSCYMKDQFTLYAAESSNLLQIMIQRTVGIHGKEFPFRSHIPVLLYNMKRKFHQGNLKIHPAFFSDTLYPSHSVFLKGQMVI